MAQDPERRSLIKWEPPKYPWESEKKVEQDRKKASDQYRNFNYVVAIVFSVFLYLFLDWMGR